MGLKERQVSPLKSLELAGPEANGGVVGKVKDFLLHPGCFASQMWLIWAKFVPF